MEGPFFPNPKLSIEENLETFEYQLKKGREYKKIAIGIFAPFYPIFWLADLPKLKEELKEGTAKIRQQLADPLYLIKWENKEAQKHLQYAQDKIKELRPVLKELQASSQKLIEKEGQESWEKKKEDVSQQIKVLQSKAIFFHEYKENLNLLQQIQKTEGESKELTPNEKITSIYLLIYQQNIDDFQSVKKSELPMLSEKIADSQEVSYIDDMIAELKKIKEQYREVLAKESKK